MHVKFIGSLLFIILALAASTAPAQSRPLPDTNFISVSGEAEVRVIPDEVMLTLGVETSDKVLKAAKAMNDERVKKILAVAMSYGIPSQNVQTDYISINPEYRDFRSTGELLGYVTRKTISIKLKDISKFENLLSDALEAGVTHVHGIEFRTSELRKHRDQARALAVKAAQEKAEALAREVGRKAGKAQSISEASWGYWSGYNQWGGNRWGSNVSQNAFQAGGSAGSVDESSLAPGQIAIKASISATFILE